MSLEECDSQSLKGLLKPELARTELTPNLARNCCMSVPERRAKPSFPVSTESHPTIDKVFDRAIHVVRRTKDLVWELKELAIGLIILWVLIKHAGPLF